MRAFCNLIQLGASDLVGHVNWRNLTNLDLQVVKGAFAKPTSYQLGLDLLVERGRRHEQDYLDHPKAKGFTVSSIDGIGIDAKSVTFAAIKAGVPVIAQAACQLGQWRGRADVLLRVEKPGQLSDWSCEIADTKFARETKGSTILQLNIEARDGQNEDP